MGERLVRNEEVVSSILIGSTNFFPAGNPPGPFIPLANGRAGCDQSIMNLEQGRLAADARQRMLANAYGHYAQALAPMIAAGRLGPDVGVTCRGKRDGAGAQAMAAISAMAMARFLNCQVPAHGV